MKNDGIDRFGPQTAHEDPGVYLFVEGGVNFVPVGEFINFIPLIGESHGVEPGVRGEIVAAVVPVGRFWADSQEIADGGMVGDLLAIDLSAVGVGALQGCSDDWVELNYGDLTGFKNILI